MRRHAFAERGLGVGNHFAVLAMAIAAGQERRNTGTPAEEADQGGCQNDQRERHVEGEDRDERGGREAKHDVVLERAPADPHHGFQHDRQHRRLEAEEQGLDDPDVAEGGVDPAQGHDGEEAGQDEERARDQPAPCPMQQPADVHGELLRLGPGQQHAVVEGMQEPVLADPALLLHQDTVHHRDLAGGAAKGERGDPGPDAHRVAERNPVQGAVNALPLNSADLVHPRTL